MEQPWKRPETLGPRHDCNVEIRGPQEPHDNGRHGHGHGRQDLASHGSGF